MLRFRTLVVSPPLAGAALAARARRRRRRAAKLTGTVGPGFTITLKHGTASRSGCSRPARYSITVADKSNIHNFRLNGPRR